jgi:hypothetical protein
MKASTKILSAILMILLITAVFAKAEPIIAEEEQPMPGPNSERGPAGGAFTQKILDDIRANDPQEADRLEQLREENPKEFRAEMKKLAGQRREMLGPVGKRPELLMRGQEGKPFGDRTRDRIRDRLATSEKEFIAWLEKNEPEKAKELAALKEKDPQAYIRRLSIEMKRYRHIMEMEATNPALAQVMKKDMELKRQINDLLEKIKGTADETQKQELTDQLKDVVSQRFDVIVQKKQLRYEELKKKLEQLQQDLNKSQTDLEKFKDNKDEQIQKHMESLLNQAEQFDWD